jgi:hypothetical protein
MAGKVTLSAQRNLLYSWDVQERLLYSITGLHLSRVVFITQYSPIVFLMMAPYSLLTIDYAQLLFDATSLLIGLFGYFMLSRSLLDSKNMMAKWILLGALASVNSWITWINGQASWLVVGFACLYLAFLLTKQDIFAALCLFMTFVKPQYGVMFLIPAFCLRRFRLLFYTGGWGLLFFGFCTSVFGWEAMIDYPKVLNQIESSLPSRGMHCLRPILELFLPIRIAYTSSVFLLLLVFLCLLFIGTTQLKGNTEVKGNTDFIRWLLSIVVVATILFSPHTHWHDLLLLTIPALLTLPFTERNQQSIDLICWRFIFYTLPITGWLCFALGCLRLPGNFVLTGIVAILFVCGLKRLLSLSKPIYLKT